MLVVEGFNTNLNTSKRLVMVTDISPGHDTAKTGDSDFDEGDYPMPATQKPMTYSSHIGCLGSLETQIV